MPAERGWLGHAVRPVDKGRHEVLPRITDNIETFAVYSRWTDDLASQTFERADKVTA